MPDGNQTLDLRVNSNSAFRNSKFRHKHNSISTISIQEGTNDLRILNAENSVRVVNDEATLNPQDRYREYFNSLLRENNYAHLKYRSDPRSYNDTEIG